MACALSEKLVDQISSTRWPMSRIFDSTCIGFQHGEADFSQNGHHGAGLLSLLDASPFSVTMAIVRTATVMHSFRT